MYSMHNYNLAARLKRWVVFQDSVQLGTAPHELASCGVRALHPLITNYFVFYFIFKHDYLTRSSPQVQQLRSSTQVQH